jgi:hypothetical protein
MQMQCAALGQEDSAVRAAHMQNLRVRLAGTCCSIGKYSNVNAI